LPAEALEEALAGLDPEQITGPGGLLTQLAGRVIETALGAELTEHLGHPPGGVPASANVRNGSTPKTVQTELGPVRISTPRDRDASFAPQLVGKRQTRLAGLDARVLDLYAGGMSTRDIASRLTARTCPQHQHRGFAQSRRPRRLLERRGVLRGMMLRQAAFGHQALPALRTAERLRSRNEHGVLEGVVVSVAGVHVIDRLLGTRVCAPDRFAKTDQRGAGQREQAHDASCDHGHEAHYKDAFHDRPIAEDHFQASPFVVQAGHDRGDVSGYDDESAECKDRYGRDPPSRHRAALSSARASTATAADSKAPAAAAAAITLAGPYAYGCALAYDISSNTTQEKTTNATTESAITIPSAALAVRSELAPEEASASLTADIAFLVVVITKAPTARFLELVTLARTAT
jgi:hypothetical protein